MPSTFHTIKKNYLFDSWLQRSNSLCKRQAKIVRNTSIGTLEYRFIQWVARGDNYSRYRKTTLFGQGLVGANKGMGKDLFPYYVQGEVLAWEAQKERGVL